MSSFIRTIQRRRLRARSDYEAAPQPTIVHSDGGYSTLTATHGWKHFSAARLRSQRTMAAILDHVMPERSRKPAKVWRQPMPVPPATETRQQRRAAAREAS